MGFSMVLFIAGLTLIDASFYDAAKVDEANRWQTFWRITLPLLRPTMVFVVVTGVISTLQVFGPVYVMSGGGRLARRPGQCDDGGVGVSVVDGLS